MSEPRQTGEEPPERNELGLTAVLANLAWVIFNTKCGVETAVRHQRDDKKALSRQLLVAAIGYIGRARGLADQLIGIFADLAGADCPFYEAGDGLEIGDVMTLLAANGLLTADPTVGAVVADAELGSWASVMTSLGARAAKLSSFCQELEAALKELHASDVPVTHVGLLTPIDGGWTITQLEMRVMTGLLELMVAAQAISAVQMEDYLVQLGGEFGAISSLTYVPAASPALPAG